MAARLNFSALALLLLGACTPVLAQTPARERFSVDALVAAPQTYVAGRYRADELPSALIIDLTAEGFTCQHSATVSQCGMTNHAFASCFDVYEVEITADRVSAEKNRRCMGAEE